MKIYADIWEFSISSENLLSQSDRPCRMKLLVSYHIQQIEVNLTPFLILMKNSTINYKYGIYYLLLHIYNIIKYNNIKYI